MDATAAPKLSQRFAIRGYPTLKFFKNGNAVDYDSGRSKADIVNYMKRKAGPVAVTYTTLDDLKTAIESAEVSVVGYFESTECEEYKNWYGVMANVDDVTAIYITDASIMDAMDVSAPAIVMYKKSVEGSLVYDGSSEGLKRWILLNQLPLVIPFSQQYSRKLFAPEHGIKVQLMFFAPEKNPGEAKPVLEEVAHMALLTLAVDADAMPAPQHLQDKHFMRKHGPQAYYGQG